MTAIRTNKTWIKFLVVIFLIVVGIAAGYYAYITYFSVPGQEEIIEEESGIETEPEGI